MITSPSNQSVPKYTDDYTIESILLLDQDTVIKAQIRLGSTRPLSDKEQEKVLDLVDDFKMKLYIALKG